MLIYVLDFLWRIIWQSILTISCSFWTGIHQSNFLCSKCTLVYPSTFPSSVLLGKLFVVSLNHWLKSLSWGETASVLFEVFLLYTFLSSSCLKFCRNPVLKWWKNSDYTNLHSYLEKIYRHLKHIEFDKYISISIAFWSSCETQMGIFEADFNHFPMYLHFLFRLINL